MVDRINTLMLATYARLQREEGQATLEYVLVLVAVAGIIAAGLFTNFGNDLKAKLDGVLG